MMHDTLADRYSDFATHEPEPARDHFAVTHYAMVELDRALSAANAAMVRLKASHSARLIDATKFAADNVVTNLASAVLMADAIARRLKHAQDGTTP